VFEPTGRVFACAELYVYVVGAVVGNDKDFLGGVARWARRVLVTKVKTEAQFLKACSLVKAVLPNLRGVREGS
jgi:hypothetical protein